MKEFFILYVLHLLAMLIAMMLIRISCNVMGTEHSFGPLGRELVAMLFIALVQLLLMAVIDLRTNEVNLGMVQFYLMMMTTGYGFNKTRAWIWDDWQPRPRWGIVVFAALTLICYAVLPMAMKNLR